MKPVSGALAASLALTLLVVGCTERDAGSPAAKPAGASSPASEPAADKWLGRWNGPEGTSLQLAGGQGKYEITIQNLDGPRTFRGSAAGTGIAFERDGVKQAIRATNGAETGMKWLTDKSNCLTVQPGEGYCRD